MSGFCILAEMAAKKPAAPPPMMAILVKEFGIKGLRFYTQANGMHKGTQILYFFCSAKKLIKDANSS